MVCEGPCCLPYSVTSAITVPPSFSLIYFLSAPWKCQAHSFLRAVVLTLHSSSVLFAQILTWLVPWHHSDLISNVTPSKRPSLIPPWRVASSHSLAYYCGFTVFTVILQLFCLSDYLSLLAKMFSS